MIGNERDFVARGMISTSAGKWYSCIEDDPFSNQYSAQEYKEVSVCFPNIPRWDGTAGTAMVRP